MSHCTECGAERQAGTRFCIGCGAEFRDEDRSWPETPIGHGPGWYAGLASGVALLVVGLVLGGMAVTGAGPWAETASVSSISSSSVTSTSPPFVSSSPPVVTTEPPASTTPVGPGNDVVAVEAPAAVDPLAPGVVDLLTAYFQSINNRDFVAYRSLYTADIQSRLNLDTLATGYRSTQDSDVRLVRLDHLSDGRLAAWTQFVSNQDAADGPGGQTCTQWSIALFLQGDATGRWWIGPVPAGYHASYAAC